MKFLWLCLLSALLAATAMAQNVTIKPGDKLAVQVAEEKSLDKEYTVTADGLILMNFLGAVKVSDLTEEEAAQQIRTQLVDQRILREATVNVKVVRDMPLVVSVSGDVESPGEYPFKDGMTLGDLLLLAKPRTSADLTAVSVTVGEDAPVVYNATMMDMATGANNPKLMAGSKVVIPAKVVPVTFTVMVSGAVAKPGLVTMTEGETVMMAIERAGGFIERAERENVQLHRTGQDPVKVNLTLEDATKLQASDVIDVPQIVPKFMVSVEGAVNRPGLLQVQEGIKLTELLREAGGLKGNAARDRILIAKGEDDKRPRSISLEAILLGYSGDVIVRPGDRVIVQANRGGPNRDVRMAAGAAVLLFLFGR